MRRTITTFSVIALVAVAQFASAAMVEVSMTQRGITTDEANAPTDTPPSDGVVYEFWVTSDADILSVDEVNIANAGDLFQFVTVGSDTAPPNPALAASFPSSPADSYITTPGANTSTTGGFDTPGSSWFDTSDDGGVSMFQFAQLTFPGNLAADLSFTGRVNVAGSAGVENFPFDFSATVGGDPVVNLLSPLGPSELDFSLGTDSTQTVTFNNSGMGDLMVTGVAINGDTNARFIAPQLGDFVENPADNFSIDVSLDLANLPNFTETLTGITLDIQTNGGDLSIPLVGVIPEPTTMILFGIGMIGAVATRRS